LYKKIDDWIQNQKGEIEFQPPGTDVYLNAKDTPNLGIKFREGRFEVKSKRNKHKWGSYFVSMP